ncbi:MAG: macro domain-containing protein [Candidatus Berkiella sp.]
MINYKQGNLLHEDAEAIVNTVNTVGVMGKGVALQFKKAYPDNFTVYKKACDDKTLTTGKVLVVPTFSMTNPQYIINFPTKQHWKGDSKIEYIEQGLKSLVTEVKRLNIQSIALPPLGCGLGGLNWSEVLPKMKDAFNQLPNVNWIVFTPHNAPDAEAMPDRTNKPKMTIGRAALLGLIDRYLVPTFDYPVSLLEVQKLVYFLTASGEKLTNLKFQKHHYGPYADVLRHVLSKMEGHYIMGYGDGSNKPEVPITLLPEAAKEAESFLVEYPATLAKFNHVAELIEGFETPHGMELLSTVHWVVMEENKLAKEDVSLAIAAIRAWNPRKASRMSPEQITSAWGVLKSKGWFDKHAQT